MTLRIHAKVSTNLAERHLGRARTRHQKNVRLLASGESVNIAADGAAALALSEEQRAHITSFRQAARNTQDGISLLQTAEGSLDEVGNILSRMRELAVEAASEVLQTTERAYLNTELLELRGEIERIAQASEFNGIKLSNGATTSLAVQVGIKNVALEDRITVTLQTATLSALGIATMTLSSPLIAFSALGTIDAALDTLSTGRSAYGSLVNRMTAAHHSIQDRLENLVSSESSIRDVDFASESADLARNDIFQQAGVAILAQANQSPGVALQLIQ